jgi:hypothetical protein
MGEIIAGVPSFTPRMYFYANITHHCDAMRLNHPQEFLASPHILFKNGSTQTKDLILKKTTRVFLENGDDNFPTEWKAEVAAKFRQYALEHCEEIHLATQSLQRVTFLPEGHEERSVSNVLGVNVVDIDLNSAFCHAHVRNIVNVFETLAREYFGLQFQEAIPAKHKKGASTEPLTPTQKKLTAYVEMISMMQMYLICQLQKNVEILYERFKQESRCCTCGEVKQKIFCCSRCKVASYCSKECQTEHWKDHKLNCVDLDINNTQHQHQHCCCSSHAHTHGQSHLQQSLLPQTQHQKQHQRQQQSKHQHSHQQKQGPNSC